MPEHGKGYRAAQGRVQDRAYAPAEAMALVKELAHAKFDETVEVAVRLGVDPRHADQMVRGAVVLPHGTGRSPRVLVFAKGDKAREAEAAGADVVGGDELVVKVQGGFLDFDVAVATPDMMGGVGRLGRLLGPRGLMPNPKAGKIEFRTEKAGIVQAPIGRVSFAAEALAENLDTLIDALVKNKPAAAKGQYIKSVTVSSTMGPGVAVAVRAASPAA